MPLAKSASASLRSDERSSQRSLILRVGLIATAERASFCLIRNISPFGLEAKLFGDPPSDTALQILIGDESPISGRVAWLKEPLIGIQFDSAVDARTIFRAAQKRTPARRRSTPRVKTMARGVLNTEGRSYPVRLTDIGPSGAKLSIGTIKHLGPAVVLNLPDLPPLKAFVRWNSGDEIGIAFQTPLPIQIIAEWIDGRVRVIA